MKKIVIILILLFNLFPFIKEGEIKLGFETLMAQSGTTTAPVYNPSGGNVFQWGELSGGGYGWNLIGNINDGHTTIGNGGSVPANPGMYNYFISGTNSGFAVATTVAASYDPNTGTLLDVDGNVIDADSYENIAIFDANGNPILIDIENDTLPVHVIIVKPPGEDWDPTEDGGDDGDGGDAIDDGAGGPSSNNCPTREQLYLNFKDNSGLVHFDIFQYQIQCNGTNTPLSLYYEVDSHFYLTYSNDPNNKTYFDGSEIDVCLGGSNTYTLHSDNSAVNIVANYWEFDGQRTPCNNNNSCTIDLNNILQGGAGIGNHTLKIYYEDLVNHTNEIVILNVNVKVQQCDCKGVPNGDAVIDNCGRCTGDGDGTVPCTLSLNPGTEINLYKDLQSINICKSADKTTFTIYDDKYNIVSSPDIIWQLNGVDIANSNGQSSQDFDISALGNFTVILKQISTGNKLLTVNCIVQQCDCAGVPLGDPNYGAYPDPNCKRCVGGITGELPCVQDVNLEWGGTAYIDNCGNIVGGSTGKLPCTQDCSGKWGGGAYIDCSCICAGGSTNIKPNKNCGVACQLPTTCNLIDLVTSPFIIATNRPSNPHFILDENQPGNISCDKPSNPGFYFTSDIINNFNDEDYLKALMKELIKVGTSKIYGIANGVDLSGLAYKMYNTFITNPGGPTTNSNVNPPLQDADLRQAVTSDDKFNLMVKTVETKFQANIDMLKNISPNILIGSLKNFNLINLTKVNPNFNRKEDLFNGLTILIHNFNSAKAELSHFYYCPTTNKYTAWIKYTLDDEYGLDPNDVVTRFWNIGGVPIPTPWTKYFEAWFVLQHYKCYHPFVNRVEISYPVEGYLQ